MENNSITPKKNPQLGIIFGLLMILSFVIIYISGVDVIESPMIGTVSSILSYFFFPVIFIFLSCLDYRKKNGGYISFVEALKTGVSTVFIGALIFVVFNAIFNFLFPEYLELVLSQTKQIMIKQKPNITQKELELGVEMARKFSSPLFTIPITLLSFSFIGLLYSCVIGLVVKKDNPQSF